MKGCETPLIIILALEKCIAKGDRLKAIFGLRQDYFTLPESTRANIEHDDEQENDEHDS